MDNKGKVALTLAIIALATSELIMVAPSFLSLLINVYNSFGTLLIILAVAGGPITMGCVALSLIKTATQPKRYQVILVRIFSIVAIVISGILLFIELTAYGLLVY